jgi:hypothetical protein
MFPRSIDLLGQEKKTSTTAKKTVQTSSGIAAAGSLGN